MELSVQRAKRMVDELVKRGISADRFLYKGWGGTRPLRDNATEEGRAQNRRVEITILE
jgi:outer membrane protein OmpA-like peptidoglycan-associated protein